MDAIVFPLSATVGYIFTSGLKSWKWDGVTWNGVPAYYLASNVAVIPSGGISATNVQGALSSLDVRISTLSTSGGPGATTASAVTIVNVGNLSGTNVQTALSDLDTRSTTLSGTINTPTQVALNLKSNKTFSIAMAVALG